tara:strand:- start:1009 stop:1404 length:396 start_codon:yes stop_codon:yes gene_type:complete
MPRKGKGSKTQSVQTAKNQSYGSAQEQEMAQEIAPLPETVKPINEPVAMQPRQISPGSKGSLFRGTERPLESPDTLPFMNNEPKLTPERSQLMWQTMPLLQAAANNPYADPDIQEVVLRMETFLPSRFDAS